MQTLRQVFALLARNWRPLVSFELIFRSVLALLLVPLLRLPLDWLMALTGRYYLTWENLPAFLVQPPVVVAIVVAVLLLSAFSVFDVSAILLILDQSREDVRVTVPEACSYAIRQAGRAFQPRNALIPLYTLVLVPLLNLGISVGAVRVLAVPEFVQESIYESPALSVASGVGLVLLAFVFFRLVYAFPVFVLEGRGFWASCRRSWLLSRHHLWGDVLAIEGIQVLLDAVLVILVLLGEVAAVAGTRFLSGSRLGLSVFASAVLVLVAGLAVVLLGLNTAVGYSCVIVRYWQHVRALGEEVPDPEPPVSHARHVRATLWRGHGVPAAIAAYCALVVVGSVGLYWLLGDASLVDAIFEPLYSRDVEVTAHRGASNDYPENTMPAFEAAREEGADWCELDVQQTSDGVVFVSHDTNLGRVSGVYENAYNLTWDEVSQLDAGAFKGEEFAGTRYPKLEEVVAWAKDNGMRLNIELKPSGHEPDFEEHVADIIHTAGFVGSCIVTSQNYATVQRLKVVAPDIRTAYVMALAYGDICQLGAADVYSIEETSCSRALVAYVHANGKQVLSWTVDSNDNMQRMISNGVDNLITDDVPLARQAVADSRDVTVVDQLVDQVVGVFG